MEDNRLSRDDVPVVGPLIPLSQDSLGDMFVMSAVWPDNNILFWFSYSVITTRVLLSAGLLGSGISNDIDQDVRPLYCRYEVAGSNAYIFRCYSDIIGSTYMGTFYYGNNRLLAIMDYDPAPDTIVLTPQSYSSYPEPDLLLAGVKYTFPYDTRASVIPASSGENRLNGIMRGFNIPATNPIRSLMTEQEYRDRIYDLTLTILSGDQLYDTPLIQFYPLRFYDPAQFCNQINVTSGYLPQVMVTAQCLLIPDSIFGQSTYCRDNYTGLTTVDECEQIGFRYYYALSSCGESFSTVNFAGELVDVSSSMGAGCDCTFNGSEFTCDTSARMSRVDTGTSQAKRVSSQTPPESAHHQQNTTLIPFIVISLIVVIIIILFLIFIIYIAKSY